MKPSSQRLMTILGSFMLMIASIYVFFSLLVPAYNQVQILRGTNQAKAQLYADETAAAAIIGDNTKGLLFQYQNSRPSQDDVSYSLPLSPKTSSLMNDIQIFAGNNQVNLDTIAFQYLPVKQSTSSLMRGIGTIRVSATLDGRYDNFKSFLKNIENNARLIDVQSLKIDGGAIPLKDSFNYNLTMDAYYQSQ